MADLEQPANGDYPEDESSGQSDIDEVEKPENVRLDKPTKSALKKNTQAIPTISAPRPELPEQPNFDELDVKTLTPLSEPIIARQATINIGTIGKGFQAMD